MRSDDHQICHDAIGNMAQQAVKAVWLPMMGVNPDVPIIVEAFVFIGFVHGNGAEEPEGMITLINVFWR